MTSDTFSTLFSAASTDRQPLGDAIAAQIARLRHRPRVLGFGEPMHGEDEFLLLRNALFAALVDQAGFTTIAIESSAWHGRIVDAYVRGGDGLEDAVLAEGFTHGLGESLANRMLVRWMREENRNRPPSTQLRFAGFDASTEVMSAPSPREPLQVLHEFVRVHVTGEANLPSWDAIDRLLGAEEPWSDQAAAMDASRSVGDEPRVHHLRAVADDLRWALAGEIPRLRRETSPDDLDEALLAGRAATSLLAYHGAAASGAGDSWERRAAIRDTVMAENLLALADRGPTLAFAHNQHLRTGGTSASFGPVTLHWLPAGAHVADRLGSDYRIIATALGEATGHDIPEPEPGSVEAHLHQGLPPGNHLLSAPALRSLQRGLADRRSPSYKYVPLVDNILDEVDQVLFVRSIAAGEAVLKPE